MNRVAVFAHYDKNNIIEDYVIYYLQELKKVADKIIFVSDCDISQQELGKIKDIVAFSIAKRHGEYDFGSYKRGYLYLQGNNLLNDYDELIFANDSCYGPLYPFEDMFSTMEEKHVDFWGNTVSKYGIDNTGNIIEFPHVQSYFIVFNQKIFTSDIFANFIKSIKREEDKNQIIIKYEMGLSHLLLDNGYSYSSYCPVYDTKNFRWMIDNFEDLILKHKNPFVKITFMKYIKQVDSFQKYELLSKHTNYDTKILNKYFSCFLMPKVSVIMPVYNGEEFLETALNSIVNQTLKEIELVCINDGSTDNSLKILEEYAKKDSRIKIYSQKNKGQGAAKNYALTLYTGDYVMFLDQDDYYELNACETAYNYALNNDVDLVIFSGETFTKLTKNENINNHIKISKYFPNLVNKIFYLRDLGESIRFVNIPPWTKIYKKGLFGNEKLRFTEGVSFEDIAFLLGLITCNPKTMIIDNILYNYNYPREGQVTQSKGMSILSIFKCFQNYESIMSSLQNYNFVKKGLLILKFQHLLYWFSRSKWYVKMPYFWKLRNEFIKLYRQGWTDNDVKQVLPLDLAHSFIGLNIFKIYKYLKR